MTDHPLSLTNDRDGHPERIIPDETSAGIVAIHLKRYEFARGYATGKRILDVACGVGYGSRYLADIAASVTGVDVDPSAVEYAQKRYGNIATIQFIEGDALNLPFPEHTFDVICSFETIEHVPDARQFLLEVGRLLAPDGIFIVSTPAARRSTHSPKNPHHVQEWSAYDFYKLLHHYFAHVELYSQIRRTTRLASLIKRLDVFKLRTRVPLAITRQIADSVGVRTMGDIRLDEIEIRRGIVSAASEVVAVCEHREKK